ncbi:uncharacterized protein RJT20DRAFT_6822 [Scheffersomyces xylosifermentans]|uniref:uncharacterized protein n=1 Tax=Scheffersomyces xylosifermentans TaxID=1304137 RepID=UPI00315C4DCB
MTSVRGLRQYLSSLVLSLPIEHFPKPSSESEAIDLSIYNSIEYILKGKSSELITHVEFEDLIVSSNAKKALSNFPETPLIEVLHQYCDAVVEEFKNKFNDESITSVQLQLTAIAFLQVFIQLNFTGPGVGFTSRELLFSDVDEELLQFEAIKLLNIEGQQAYDLISDPLFLIIAELLFEKLMGISSKFSLIAKDKSITLEELVEATGKAIEGTEGNPIAASLQWWRSRALQVHLSVVSEPPNSLVSITSLLLNPSVPNSLMPAAENMPEIQKLIQMLFFLECARGGIHGQTEHLSIPFLTKAKKLSEFSFLLSGAKAKRTKFQQFHTSALIVLAKSKSTSVYDVEDSENPESFNLDSDLLLEKPQYESLDDLDNGDDSTNKRIKLDFASIGNDSSEEEEEKLLPIALRQENIPAELKELDPNDQPPLSELDNLQLLLRLVIIRQTSPAQNELVKEEMMAVVSRILYTSSKTCNWTLFSRALWERSLLETNKSRTIERGILQMTSLVEEIGIKIKTRVLPSAKNEEISPASTRLRFIHQLPLLPQWQMDAQLAEKYMSLGVFKSAIDIFERLQLTCEAALCYAATDNEVEAERILIERIQKHPEDARAVSILGDVRQDPELWLKAWEIGRYSKAKCSLSHYYYGPPKSSGLTKNLDLALMHMNDCLTSNPLSYENWFFYGCCGLESSQFELASEAFTRCVSLDDSNSHAWSNLASALIKLDKTRPAFNALKKAIRSGGDNKSWRIYENYLTVAARLNEWNDVLIAARELIEIRAKSDGELTIDIPVLEKLTEILVSTEYPRDAEARMTYYQSACIDLICNVLPTVITSSARCWRIVARVELWRSKPWAALECHEKAYRALSQKAELEFEEPVWNEAVDACADLVGAYESLGERPGKHGADDLVCKDWKYKAKTTVRSLMSKGKSMWEDSEGWERLQGLKEELAS